MVLIDPSISKWFDGCNGRTQYEKPQKNQQRWTSQTWKQWPWAYRFWSWHFFKGSQVVGWLSNPFEAPNFCYTQLQLSGHELIRIRRWTTWSQEFPSREEKRRGFSWYSEAVLKRPKIPKKNTACWFSMGQPMVWGPPILQRPIFSQETEGFSGLPS